MQQPVIFAEKGEITKRHREKLEGAGYIVVPVKDVNNIKTVNHEFVKTDIKEDGFGLNA